MYTEHLNRWIAIGANIGVLIGIILLVFEIGQTRDMMRSQTRQEIAQEQANFSLVTAADQKLTELIARVSSGEILYGAERLQYVFRLQAWFRLQENVHYQARQGLFDDSEFSGVRRSWRGFANANPGVRWAWCFLRDGMSPAYRTDMDAAFEGLDCDVTFASWGSVQRPDQ